MAFSFGVFVIKFILNSKAVFGEGYMKSSFWKKLDTYIDELCRETISGCSCLILQNGIEQYRKYAGKCNLQTGEAPNENTLYRIYSLTKLYTAVAALQLIEQKKLRLDAAVADYIPEYKYLNVNHVAANGWNNIEKARNPLLISHLLTMRSGISYSYDNDGPTMCQTKREVINFRQQKKDYTTQEYARLFSGIPLAFEPGTHFLYGAGYDVLAAIIEIVSEMSLGDYLQRYIWEPLELENTMFRFRSIRDKENLCQMYQRMENGDLIPVADKDWFYQPGRKFEEGGGGVLSTLDDYMRFQQCLLDGGIWRKHRILSEGYVEMMHTNVLTQEQMRDFTIPDYGYGYGVRVRVKEEGKTPVGEFGWYGSSGNYGLIDPTNRLCFLYMQQMIPGDDKEIHPKLRRYLYEDFSKD